MFPQTNITDTTATEEETTMGTSFLFDFDLGDLTTVDGKVVSVTGLDAVKGWIKKIMNTEKSKFAIYETDEDDEYGIKLRDFINADYSMDFIKIELEREIKEALYKNADITKVHTFYFSQNKRNLNCSFIVETIYGTTGGEVTI